MQVIYWCSSPLLLGKFDSFTADSDDVMDRLPDGLTDESIDVYMEGSFPGYCVNVNIHTGVLRGIFTVNLADGRTDRADDRHTG